MRLQCCLQSIHHALGIGTGLARQEGVTIARALLTLGHSPQGFPGHKDAVTGLAFREGTQQLFSASLDRTVKIWSLAERAYVDTLYGHQAGVLAVDVLRQVGPRAPGFMP